jgi:lipid-A-disaccharide synthase
MPEKGRIYRLFISAAEPSADAHCAALVTALRKSGYNIEFIGVGGARMASAGCNLLATTTAKAAMMYKAFRHVFSFYRLLRHISRFFRSTNVDLVIVCDSPAFNFHIAKIAKRAGTRTLFYVAPQLWVWGSWRLSKLRKFCDKLCCILPFEQNWFRQRGIDTVFVGNPLLDGLAADLQSCRKRYADFEPKAAKIMLLPGSRAAEIAVLWPAFQQIALRLKQKYPDAAFTAVAVDESGKEILHSRQIPGFQCEYVCDSVSDIARWADFAIAASGSVTLQTAAAGCPMVVMYQTSRIGWHLLGRWLLKTKYLSLVNILAAKQLVPEFMPYFGSIEPIVRRIEQLLEDKAGLAQTSAELLKLVEPLRAGSASDKVAGLVLEMLA